MPITYLEMPLEKFLDLNNPSNNPNEEYKLINKVLEDILKYIFNITQNPSLLEIGCANGSYLRFLKERYQDRLKLVGIDIKNFPFDSSYNFSQMDTKKLGFPNETFQIIISNRVIDITNPPFYDNNNVYIALQEAKRVLKRNGFIVVYGAIENPTLEKLSNEFDIIIYETPFTPRLNNRNDYRLISLKKIN
ncbi:MAG: class I SAM-dependent methyltransferase [Candidatus Woesearchaeota archaeon]